VATLKLGVKLDGVDGSKIGAMVAEGRINDVAAYCEIDVVITYQLWLHYQLFRGGLTREQFLASKAVLRSYLSANEQKKPHLSKLLH
jgi:predicted PolB exonuclease-like 3'-5' exonuclease